MKVKISVLILCRGLVPDVRVCSAGGVSLRDLMSLLPLALLQALTASSVLCLL
ncbi:unnamed protein product [Prunus armeniaca]